MRRATLFAAIVASAPLARIEAQDPLPVRSGDLVRILHTCAMKERQRMTIDCTGGRVLFPVAFSAIVETILRDTLLLAAGAGGIPVAVPLSRIDQVDIRRRGSAWGKGAKIGGTLGGVLGAVGMIAFVSTFCLFDCPADPTGGELLSAAVLGAVGGGLTGGLLGALIAAPFPNPIWKTVYRRQPTVKVSIRKMRDSGFGLGASVRF